MAARGGPARQRLRRAWAEFRSMRTALVLLCTLAGASVLGSLFPQRPVSPDRVDGWLAAHPGIGPVLDRLGVFDVFGSAWFSAIYVALLAAVIACLVPRGRALARLLAAPPPRGGGRLDRYRSAVAFQAPGTPERAAATARRVLAGRRFRVAAHGPGELAAEKGYLRELGSILFHASFLLLLVGLALGKGTGFRGQMSVVEGDEAADARINYDVFTAGRFFGGGLPPFTLRLDDFTSTFRAAGQPAGFGSQLTVTGADGRVQRQRVTVNRPLTVDGVRVFQSDYGYAPWVTVTAPSGEVLSDGPVELLRNPDNEISTGAMRLPSLRPQLGLELTFFTGLRTPAQPGGGFQLVNRPQLDNPVLVAWPWQGDLRASRAASVFTLDVSRLRRAGPRPLVLRPGQTAGLPGGGTIALRSVRQYTVLTLARDRGVPVVGAAAGLILLGLLPSLYVRRRRVWVRAEPAPGGTRVELAGLALQGRLAFTAEFERLAGEVRAALGAPLSPARAPAAGGGAGEPGPAGGDGPGGRERDAGLLEAARAPSSGTTLAGDEPARAPGRPADPGGD